MNNRRETVVGLFLAAIVAILALAGCRAFEPEAVIVNKAPETFIIGAPLEHGGGYYRFHVFWYGSDADGRVERFVWALTDTTVQDEETTTDEENQRFNPALNASTLDIGHWTTKTDSIFNFRIDQETSIAADMTLHMVAVDDYGDYDRTPARLHFFSNSLGNPTLEFFRIDGTDTIPIAAGQADTVGFGFPYTVYWEGVSPNIRGYSTEALAEVDTVEPYWDGLYGFKYQLLGDLGGNCIASLEDCWQPRRFNEATGDSFSVFADSIRTLTFRNDGSSNDPFGKLLPSGSVNLEVNSVDVAGVEVANFMRPFTFLVNFDPETRILNGESDPYHPEDTEVYPYYIRLNDPTQEHHPFVAGDRIPDRSYVVVKALARDDPRDGPYDPDYKIGIAGYLQGTRNNFTGGTFSFSSESSALRTDPPWDATCDTCWYADTLGFLVAPRTEFTINMQSVDEHGRRDGTPASLSFEVGYPPCVQCVEMLPSGSEPSAFNPSLACIDDPLDTSHPCIGDTTVFKVSNAQFPPPDALEFIEPTFMFVEKNTGFVAVSNNPDAYGDTYYRVDASMYRMTMLLHGQDDPRENYGNALTRNMGWQYQIDYLCDPFNEIKDGGGNDDIREPTWGRKSDATDPVIDAATGLWKIFIDVPVPFHLMLFGEDNFKAVYMNFTLGITDPDTQDWVFERLTRQFGTGTVRVISLDQTQCQTVQPARPAKYNFFRNVRPSVAELPAGLTWRDCELRQHPSGAGQGIQLEMDLSRGSMASHDLSESEWITKHFKIIVETSTGDYECVDP